MTSLKDPLIGQRRKGGVHILWRHKLARPRPSSHRGSPGRGMWWNEGKWERDGMAQGVGRSVKRRGETRGIKY